MSTEHTKGPWFAGDKKSGTGGYVFTQNGDRVAEVLNSQVGETEEARRAIFAEYLANARLIAAAPSLYEAAQAMSNAIQRTTNSRWLDLDNQIVIEAHHKLRDAIRKAKGEA